jgi:integrase
MKYMATIYFRKNGDRGLWWVKFYHPLDARCHRTSLGTPDESAAKKILRRLEAEIEMRRPELAPLPASLSEILGPNKRMRTAESADLETLPSPEKSATVINALRAYYTFIKADNDSHHAAGKLSILRAFFGSSVVEEATGESCRTISPPVYKGKTLDGLTPLVLQDFVSSRKIEDSTRKHYRQVFHHFIEKMIDLSLYVPSNHLRPNPAAALPTYQNKNEVITFLSDGDIEAQVKALSSEPMIQLGVEIMIHAGLRREEVAGLRTEDISPDRRFIKVAKYIDPRTQKPRKLKTGWRDVPIVPILKERLLKHLEGHDNYWLLPGWNKERWTADNFSKTLSSLNKSAGLSWTCNEFRHTYATRLAKDGASLFKIAKLMGNSHQIVERYYAQFILNDPD